MKNRENLQGFTLIEILIVIGLIAILAAVTIIALNPGENFTAARNSERKSEVAQIASALTQWYIEPGNGDYTTLNLGAATPMPTCGGAGIPIPKVTGTAELYDALVPAYLADIPNDPDSPTGSNTNYNLCADETRFTITAPNAVGETISVSR